METQEFVPQTNIKQKYRYKMFRKRKREKNTKKHDVSVYVQRVIFSWFCSVIFVNVHQHTYLVNCCLMDFLFNLLMSSFNVISLFFSLFWFVSVFICLSVYLFVSACFFVFVINFNIFVWFLISFLSTELTASPSCFVMSGRAKKWSCHDLTILRYYDVTVFLSCDVSKLWRHVRLTQWRFILWWRRNIVT